LIDQLIGVSTASGIVIVGAWNLVPEMSIHRVDEE